MNPGQKAGVFYWRKIAKGEKDKQLQCGAQTDVQFCGLISASIIVSDAVLKPKDKTSENNYFFRFARG